MSEKILVVDDEFVNRQVICAILKQIEGYEVEKAEDGPTALAMMAKKLPDLVLLDIMMPGMDGYEVCRIMQEDTALMEIPVIFVTALIDREREAEAFARGAVDYLIKPLNAATLKARVRAHLQIKRQRHMLQEQNESLERIAAELQQAKDRLELRVIERTGELARKNVMLEREIEERREAQRALEKARAEAERASQAKSEFLATISHEVRTPMTGAIGMINLALETELSPKQREYLNMAKSSAVAMLDMLNNILDFSRAESGRLLMEAIAFQPAAVVWTVIDQEAVMAREKGLTMEADIHENVPTMLLGDPTRLRQILLNLVRNAIKFTERGRIWITCGLGESKEATANTQSHTMLHFTVRDTGVGIPPEAREKIFAPFVQADASTTRKHGGVGLGLSICQKLVEMMGGNIWVEDSVHTGACFHFTANFANAPDEPENVPEIACRRATNQQSVAADSQQEDTANAPEFGAQTTKPPRASKGFDYEQALARTGDKQTLANLVADFLQAAPGLLQEVGAASANQDSGRLVEVLQMLRAGAARVGATAIGDEAFRLQLAVRRDDWERAQHAVEQLLRLFSIFQSTVRESEVMKSVLAGDSTPLANGNN